MGQGRRATAGIATLLALLLLLHHPLMGLTPMTPATGLSGQGMEPAMAASFSVMPPVAVGASAAVAATGVTGTQAISDGAACTMTCPLMNGITPGRPALRSPGAQRDGHAPWPPLAAVGALPTPTDAAHNLAARSAGPIPDQRTRRAILQVYLL